jgi:hypothetical protein
MYTSLLNFLLPMVTKSWTQLKSQRKSETVMCWIIRPNTHITFWMTMGCATSVGPTYTLSLTLWMRMWHEYHLAQHKPQTSILWMRIHAESSNPTYISVFWTRLWHAESSDPKHLTFRIWSWCTKSWDNTHLNCLNETVMCWITGSNTHLISLNMEKY